MTYDEYLLKAIDLGFEVGRGTPNAFAKTFKPQRDDTTLLAAIDLACEFLDDRMDVVDGEDGPRPDAFMSLYQHLDEVRARARGERWPR